MPKNSIAIKVYPKTVKRLSDLDVFRHPPSIDFLPVSGAEDSLIHAQITLELEKKQGAQFDIETNTSNLAGSGFTMGLAASLDYRNRNIFRGAEVWVISLEAGVDFNLSPDSLTETRDLLNLLDISAGTQLYFPNFVFFRTVPRHFENAKSSITFGYRLLQQSTDFTVQSLSGSFGYTWDIGSKQQFAFNPMLLHFSFKPKFSNTFQENLESGNIALFNSLNENYLIPSFDFSHALRLKWGQLKQHSLFLKSYLESAGLAWYGLDLSFNPDQAASLLGTTYSQYFRFDTDFRYSVYIDRKQSLITRIMLGCGLPYGNSGSTGLPYSRQFYLGGPNSMRAWTVRHLGPGRVVPESGAEFQLGDFRLEMNMEYRFKLNSWIGGAFFADIGNIWLLNPPASNFLGAPQRLEYEGKLTSTFFQELGIGIGTGLRLDFSFLIIRVDVAWQLYNPAGYGLRTDRADIKYWNDQWNALSFLGLWSNLNGFNGNWILGVGYPF